MNKYAVVEKNNHNAVHCYTWSVDRAQHWIDTVDLNMMMDKTLTRDSFEIVWKGKHK